MELAITAQCVERATDPAGIINASHDAFACLLLVLERLEQPDTELFPSAVMAAAIAANGRDALAFAPSLQPRGREGATREAPVAGVDRGIVLEIERLCQLLAIRLNEAAAIASQVRDRAATWDAAQCAREIEALFGGEP